MQVTVALAHESCPAALREDLAPLRELVSRPGAKRFKVLDVGGRRRKRVDLVEVLLGELDDALRRAPGAVVRRALDARMKIGHGRRKRIDLRWRERAALRHAIEQRVLREPAHLHRILDRGRRAEARILRRAADRNDLQVQRRRRAPVQPQFFLAKALARFERGEVEEPEIDGLLELVGVLAREQHPGDVGLDQLDTLGRMRIAVRVEERRDQGTRRHRRRRDRRHFSPPPHPPPRPAVRATRAPRPRRAGARSPRSARRRPSPTRRRGRSRC